MSAARFGTTALLASAIALSGCEGCSQMLQRMEVQGEAKSKPYGENPLFADGRAMRPVPAGTVPRERLAALRGPHAGSRPDGGGYLTEIPVPLTPALMARGQQRYDVVCATCHGLLGDGQSPVARNMALRPPPSLHDYREKPVGYLFEVVSDGFGLMPGYAAELPLEERWAVVAYVRALQRSQHAPLEQAPAEERGRLESLPADAAPTPAPHEEKR